MKSKKAELMKGNEVRELQTIEINFNDLSEEQRKVLIFIDSYRSEIKRLDAYGLEMLKQWAFENGSDLLKARISEGMNWLTLADEEYFSFILPAGCEYLVGVDESWPIKNATLEQINALRDFRQHVNPNPFFGRKSESRKSERISHKEMKKRIEEAKKEIKKFPTPGILTNSIALMRYKYNGDYTRHVDVIQFKLRSLSLNEKTFEKVLSAGFDSRQ